MEIDLAARLSTLGHKQRLALFQLLMRRYPDHVPAGEIAGALGIKPSTLSTYLNALMQAGLVAQKRDGTSLLYAADMPATQQMFDAFFNQCCHSRPELCATPDTGARPMPGRKFNVLFICSGNSARSIFAETLLRAEAGDRFNAFSAGTRPYSELNPFALDVLRAKGHDISDLRSKHVAEFQTGDAPQMDFVFTVCNQAANEHCESWQGQPISAHWGMPDPVKAEGSDAEKSLAFQQAYGALRNRILNFTALPVAALDRISLQKAVDDIARQEMGAEA